MWIFKNFLLLGSLLLFSFSALSKDCPAWAEPNQPIYGLDVVVTQTGIRIPNGWSHLSEIEVIRAPEGRCEIKVGDKFLILWVKSYNLPLLEVGVTFTNVGIEKDNFSPNFEPKNYFNLLQDPKTVPRFRSFADWNQLTSDKKNELLDGSQFDDVLGLERSEWTGIDLQDGSILPEGLARQVDEFVSQEISTDVEDVDVPYSTVGPVEFFVEATTLSDTGEIVGLSLSIRQNGAMDGKSETTHYENQEEAVADGADLHADVSWSTHIMFDVLENGELRVYEGYENYLSWSGH